MSTRASSNNFRAGLFIVFSLIMGVVVILWVANKRDGWMVSRTSYVVRFNIRDGASGLKPESSVRVGGQSVGVVTAVDFKEPAEAIAAADSKAPAHIKPETAPSKETASIDYVYVTIKIRSDLKLYSDAEIYLELPLLGSVSTINIPSLGGGPKDEIIKDGLPVKVASAELLKPWQIIPGGLAPPTFLSQAGYGATQKAEMQRILANGAQLSDRVNNLIEDLKERLDPALDHARDSLGDIRYMTAELRKKSDSWIDRLNGALADARETVAQVLESIKVNRPKVDSILTNAQELTDKINHELYNSVRDGLNDGRKALADAATITQQTKTLLAEEVPELRTMLANFRLSSDQLKLTMTEVRRNPWRLLYQPRRKELEEELTYDSARTYADAVGQLRQASAALESVLEVAKSTPNGPTETDRKTMAQITNDLQAAFERYRLAEKQFLDRLVGDKPE